MAYIKKIDVRLSLSGVSCPALVIHKRRDKVVRLAAGRHLADSLPDAKLEIIEGGDHWFWTENPERIVNSVVRHIRMTSDQSVTIC